MILGSKDTTLLVLDTVTGELIEEMAALGGRIVQIADLVGEHRACSPMSRTLHCKTSASFLVL